MQIALNESKLSEEKVKAELQHVQEENARLKKSKEQVGSAQGRQHCFSFELNSSTLLLVFLSISSQCLCFLNSRISHFMLRLNLNPLGPMSCLCKQATHLCYVSSIDSIFVSN